MRHPSRISPILDLFERIWLNCPDQRFGQLVENMGINFNTEDLNEGIVKMCEFAGIPVMDEVLWGTYGKSGKEPLRYVKLCECSTEHLNEILKIGELSLVVKLCIQKILKERVDK